MKSEFTDTTTITGLIEEGTKLAFNAYQEVRAGDQKVGGRGELLWHDNGAAMIWTQTEIDELGEAVCTAQPIWNLGLVDVPAGDHDGLTIESAPITTSLATKVFWVESLWSADGDLIHVGECGIPNETTTVSTPQVTTKAVPTAHPGEPVHDVAIVDGPVPAGATLTFQAYRIPEGYDTAINDVTAPSPTPLAPSDDEPAGAPDEEATGTDSSTESATDDAATPDIAASDGGKIAADPAFTPEAYIDPRVGALACRDAELVFDSSDEPVAVNEENANSEYTSPSTTFDALGTYYWVETLHAADGSIIHRGACGAEGETTTIKPVPPALATTGASNFTWLAAAGGVLLLTGAATLMLRPRRVQAAADQA